MPILEILQRLHYAPSYIEEMLEATLAKYGMRLSKPVISGDKFEDIQNGIWRLLMAGEKSLTYVKFFKDVTVFMKTLKNDPGRNLYIDEKTLLDVISSNGLYSEDIALTEQSVQIALVNYPCPSSKSKLVIDFKEEMGIDLFAKVVNNFYETPFDLSTFREQIGDQLEISLSKVENAIMQMVPRAQIPTTSDYVAMMVKYFVE